MSQEQIGIDPTLNDRSIPLALLGLPGVWRVASVAQQPSIRISNWSIKHMEQGDFFVGDTSDGDGRVSTAIQTFDPNARRGITASGRVYELVGESSGYLSRNASHVWNYYKESNRLTELDSEARK